MITYGANSHDKVGNMTTVDFRYYTHGQVSIRITIVIHECFSYYLVLNMLVWVTDMLHNTPPFTLNNGLISCDKCVTSE